MRILQRHHERLWLAVVTLLLMSCRLASCRVENGGNNSTSMPQGDDYFEESQQDWSVLRTTLFMYIPVAVLLLLLFCLVRRKYPTVYAVRRVVARLYSPLAETSHGFVEWIWKLWLIPERNLLEQCSLDAVCLLRILRLGCRVACIGAICSWFLVPIYVTAPSPPPSLEYRYETDDTFVVTTTSNVSYGSRRFTATILAAYIIFGATMYMILQEFKWFIARRVDFLTKKTARNYTVYVSGIPPRYRSNEELARFFRRVVSADAVHSAAVVLHIPKLNAATVRQATLQRQLERALVLKALGRVDEPMATVLKPNLGPNVVERVPAIEHYRAQLEQVRMKIHNLRALIDCKQRASNAGILEDVMSRLAENLKPTDSCPAIHVESIAVGTATESLLCNEGNEVGIEIADDAHREELSDFVDGFAHGERNNVQVDDVSIECDIPCRDNSTMAETLETRGVASNSRGMADLASQIARTIGLLGSDDNEGRPLSVGFVTFTKLSAVTVALQLVHSTVPFEMEVVEAPAPDEILWDNIGLENRDLQVGRLLAFASTTAICIFWTVPVTFLVSLTELNALQEKLVFLQRWLEKAPWLASVLNQIAPLLLTFLNAVLLPLILRRVSRLEGVLGMSHLEASLYSKLAAFQVSAIFCPIV
jgi:Late exocytosis, associated with Golgi transport/Calcium-dependent channel, 7TM region, putative phosphate/Cytosolic domain of 10TM putative phosphate transporter